MASIEIINRSFGWLVIWLEPLGEDRWLRAGERFRVQSDYPGGDGAFSLVYWSDADDTTAGIQNVECWVEKGDAYAEVHDATGSIVECGYQRPAEVNTRWVAQVAELEQRRRRDWRLSDCPLAHAARRALSIVRLGSRHGG